jgi:hypothetical protein
MTENLTAYWEVLTKEEKELLCELHSECGLIPIHLGNLPFIGKKKTIELLQWYYGMVKHKMVCEDYPVRNMLKKLGVEVAIKHAKKV